MVLVKFGSNVILVEPLKTQNTAELICRYDKLVIAQGLPPKISFSTIKPQHKRRSTFVIATTSNVNLFLHDAIDAMPQKLQSETSKATSSVYLRALPPTFPSTSGTASYHKQRSP
ncbi:hypothetical protein ACHAW6_005806 [Cyclotella cf. meneghiniana]